MMSDRRWWLRQFWVQSLSNISRQESIIINNNTYSNNNVNKSRIGINNINPKLNIIPQRPFKSDQQPFDVPKMYS